MKKYLFLIFFSQSISCYILAQTYEFADSLSNAAMLAQNEGNFLKAAKLFELSAEAEMKYETPREAVVYYSLVDASLNYHKANQFDKAFELRKNCFNQFIKVFGKEHEDYGTEVAWIGWYYKYQGHYQKALPFYMDALENIEKSRGRDHSEYGIVLNYLAGLYRTMGKYNQALLMHQEALENIKKSLGKDHSEYGIAMNDLAGLYHSMGQYDQALPLHVEALGNIEKSLGKDHSEYGNAMNDLASLYHRMGQYDKALPLYLDALENIVKSLGKDHSSYGDILNDLALLYDNMDQKDKALPIYLEALENTEKSLGKEHSSFGVRLNNLALWYDNIGQYDQSLPLYLGALENMEKNFGKDHPSYGITLNNLAVLYKKIGQFDQALPLSLKALENAEKSLGKDHPSYVNRLNSLAVLYMEMGQYDQALPLYLESLESTEKNLGKDHPSYSVRLNNLALLYKNLGQYEKALPFSLMALENSEKNLEKGHSDYWVILNNLALIYREMDQFEKAEILFLEVLKNAERSLGKDHSSYGLFLYNLAELYLFIGQHDKALPMFLEALENTEKSLGKVDLQYCSILNNLARTYNELGQYDKALTFYLEAFENIKKNLKITHPLNGTILGNLAGLYSSLGQYDKALSLYQEALYHAEKYLGKNNPHYGSRLSSLAGLYMNLGQYDKALPLYQEYLENTEKNYGKERWQYGVALNGLAGLFHRTGKYDQALSLNHEALGNIEKSLGKENLYYSRVLTDLARIYETMGKYDQSLPMYKDALKIDEKIHGKDHSVYAVSLNNLAGLYSKIGQSDKVLPLYLEALENIKEQIKQAFSFMSENQKEQFQKKINHLFEVYQSFFFRYSAVKSEVASYSYDVELAIKGMILQSGIEVRESIMNSNDSIAIAKFNEWSLLRNILAQQYSLPIAERRSDINEVEARAEEAEADLSRLSSTFLESSMQTSANWQAVQNVLKSGEVAIEFTSFDYHNGREWTDSTMYIAIVLSKGEQHPQLIPLFEQQQLDEILPTQSSSDAGFVSSLYRGSDAKSVSSEKQISHGEQLYKLLWQPLEKFIPENSTVYFVPSGSLHQLALSAIPARENKLLSDRYKLKQLTSTDILVGQEEEMSSKPQSLTLFGGIQYEAENELMLAQVENLKTTQGISRALPQDLDRGNTSWNYLPGTLLEVNSIAALARQSKIKTQLFTDNTALEEQVKALAGAQSPQVLHIATHGFFFPDPKQEKRNNFQLLDENKITYRASDNPMQRSGLLFSGANNAWLGLPIPEGLDDGILTAFEVSNLYLGNTQLVVLSACETGLGDIKGSEGVFGLQRAFKQAGVDYLLMSLWKIPDNETAQFMEYFYEQWFAGSSIPDSFRATQNYMKKQHHNDPYKWAGFVLVQ